MKGMAAVIVIVVALTNLMVIDGWDMEIDIDGRGCVKEPSRGDPYIIEDTRSISIGNDHLEIVLDKNTKCGISRIIDKASGVDLRENKVPPPVILMIMYRIGDATDIVIQWDADDMTVDKDVNTTNAKLTLWYSGFRSNNLNATVIIDLGHDSRQADFRLSIRNDENFTVRSLFFPVVWGLGSIGDSSEDDSIFYPVGDGLLLKDPLKYKDDLHMTEMYPSTASMQMMCHYDEDEAGLYMTTDDSGGHPKKPTIDSMEWSSANHMAMFFEHLVPETGGNDPALDYGCQIGTFKGDWYDAADIYGEWALGTDFVKEGKVFEEKDTPDWWSRTSIVSSSNRDADLIHNSLSDIENMTSQFNELTGVNTTHLIFAWAQNGAWCGPYYFPPAAGEENFTDSMVNITNSGGHSFLYISGSVWRITRDDIGYADYELFNDLGRKWACIDEHGNPIIDQGYLSINWTSARMCPMTDFWQDMVVGNLLGCLDLGVDVVQIDEFPIGSVYPCHNGSHGHPPGYSNEITASYRRILERSRELGRSANPDLIMSMEEPCEFYIPYMDTYVSRDNAPEFMLYPIAVEIYGDDMEFIPFFSRVYHEYITAFAEPIPMNNDYPETFINQMRRSVARAFVSGEIISGSADERENLRPEVLNLYNTTVRASSGYCNEYLIRGKPLRPPSIDVPETEVDWYFYSNQSMGRSFNESSVLHSSWEADDGDIGHVFVNWVNREMGFDVHLHDHGLPSGEYSLVITRNGQGEILRNTVEFPLDVTLDMSPGDVILLELTKVPDLDLDVILVDHDERGILTNDTYSIISTVTNRGTGESSDFAVDLLLDGEVIDSVNVPGLTNGEVFQISFELDTGGLLGEHNLSMVCDRYGEILETDLTNNEIWRIIEVLERPRSDLRIIVNDPENRRRIDNATVRLSGLTGNLSDISDLSGEVIFAGLVAGNYTVVCTRDHYMGNVTGVVLPEGVEMNVTIDLEWIEYPFISGLVVDNNTEDPIPEAEVILIGSLHGVTEFSSSLLTTLDGMFNFTDLEPGYEYTIDVSVEGFLSRSVRIDLSDPIGDLMIGMDRVPPVPGRISGRVIDNDTDEPIEGVSVGHDDGSVFTDEDGYFVIMDLFPGIYSLIFTAEGYITEGMDAEVLENETTDLLIRMNMTPADDPRPVLHTIEGIIMDGSDEPIEGARVLVVESSRYVFSDENGQFEFANITPGNYTLRITADGFETIEIEVSSGSSGLSINMESIEEDPGNTLVIVFVVMVILLILGSVILVRRWRFSSPEEE